MGDFRAGKYSVQKVESIRIDISWIRDSHSPAVCSIGNSLRAMDGAIATRSAMTLNLISRQARPAYRPYFIGSGQEGLSRLLHSTSTKRASPTSRSRSSQPSSFWFHASLSSARLGSAFLRRTLIDICCSSTTRLSELTEIVLDRLAEHVQRARQHGALYAVGVFLPGLRGRLVSYWHLNDVSIHAIRRH